MTWIAGGGLALAVKPSWGSETSPSPWIAIAPDGTVTLTTTALEMGQGSRTGQAQVLADELDADWTKVIVVQSSEAPPYLLDGALYSGGSQTLRTRFALLRAAGATVRCQLVQAAARRWKVEAASCFAQNGEVVERTSGRRIAYGALAADAARETPPANPVLKPASEWRYIGKSISTVALRDKVTGQARYGIDFRLPGMVFASIRQSPVAGETLVEVDEGPALAIAGVVQVVRLKDAVAVVAKDTWTAFKAVRSLDPHWSPSNGRSSPQIRAALSAALDAPDATISPRAGGSEMRAKLRAAYRNASRRVEATYELAYLSHSPMEPMNATAIADATHAEIWAPCQSPTWLRDEVVATTGLAKENITIHPLMMGGGFGRRLKGDYAARAVQVAQAVGKPVQVVWTREEDMTHDFYRPAMQMTFRATLSASGGMTGYEVVAATADDLTGGHQPKPYELADYAATLSNAKLGVPIGSWRSVDPGMALFAKESFIDECAHEAGAEPLAYRDALLGNNARARRVLHAAADAIGWSAPTPKGIGRGLALLQEWDTVVAHAIEVEVVGQRLRVVRVVAAADLGTVVNPQQVRAQFEGGAVMGLSAALGEQVTFTDGRADQTNFNSYPVLRINQTPPIEVLLFETPNAPIGGAGEPPVPGIAPACATQSSRPAVSGYVAYRS